MGKGFNGLWIVALLVLSAFVISVFTDEGDSFRYLPKPVVSRPLRQRNTSLGPKLTVSKTVANLRAKMVPMKDVAYEYDSLELSQVVFNEPLHLLEDNNEWLLVEALQQPNLYNGEWGPYVGYVQRNEVVTVNEFPRWALTVTATNANIYSRSCHMVGCVTEDIHLIVTVGVWLEPAEASEQFGWWKVYVPTEGNSKGSFGWILSDAVKPIDPIPQGQALRDAIVATGRQMFGWYYFWGGRSAFVSQLWSNRTILTGVDCSGFVGTAYRTHGILLPRDASPMFAKSQNVTGGPQALLAGDLFFYARKSDPMHMFHVMMYAGNENLMESSTNSTRMVPVSVAFGVEFQNMQWGGLIRGGDTLLYWGRYIATGKENDNVINIDLTI